jgi:hypothetical protein
MGGFRGLSTTMTIPHDEDGGGGNTKLSIMISTDFALRSLDVPNVTHLINFNLPINGDGGYDAYVLRGGEEQQPTLPWLPLAETLLPLLLPFLPSLLLSSPLPP